MRLAGKVALVTGGGSGIGRGISIRYAEEGADVAVADMNLAGAEETSEEVRRLGHRGVALEANVTGRADCERIVRETVDALGKLDIFVANAGIGRPAAFLEVTEEDWNAVIDTNLNGVFFSCQAAARQMVSQGHGGRIIAMASVAAEQASGFMASYHSSKAAVRMLTKVMAIELGQHRITVNAIAPGVIETPLTVGLVEAIRTSGREVAPMGRLGDPKDVANAALFLASDEAEYVSGGMIFVDGGMAAGRRMG
jgi:NAD(P)-dependent dehydrogenase (short-subunit alcohol dehydrogenase family)